MRARARWAIAPLLAAPAGAWALGLGQIELQSALNQPFRAEIALSATPEEMQGLRVALAGPAMFEQRGLDRPPFLNSLEFRVVAGRDGRNVVQVTSRESIAEPFVTLLVEATAPRGRNVREYTVFLDPPVLLPAPATPPAVRPAETRTSGNTSGGTINRSTPAPAPAPAEPTPRAPATAIREPETPSVSSTAPAPRQPVSAAGGTYGPVQRAETLWAISDRLRPDGVTVNQMMIAIYQSNPSAFGGNINVLRAGATLRLPESADFATLATTVANAEVQRQTDEWQNRAAPGGQLRLLPPSESETARATPPASAVTPAPRPAEPPAPSAAERQAAAAAAAAEEERRLIEIRNAELRAAQEAAANAQTNAPPPAEAEVADPGVEVESEQLFADETEPAAEVEQPAATPTPAPVPQTPVSTEPSLVSQAIGWLLSPILWIGLGVAALLLSALWFVRRRRQDTEDVTGRWEALESETDDDNDTRNATERMRRQVPEQTIVVEEQHAEQLRPAAPEPEPPTRRSAQPRPQKTAAPIAGDETLSSQTVINLDQADAVAEADFHIAYGLYDQAAELVQKALEAAPDRRDLKLKLLEVFFMWGNKDAFLKAAQGLRADIGQGDDPDWNKVVIMGKQICPDERLFTESTGGAGRVDVDLEAGDSPLDLAFDDAASADIAAASSGLDLDLEASDERPAPKPAAKSAARRDLDLNADGLDIGARTAAGLEAALFENEDEAGQTTPDIAADALAVTQESPTIERPRASDWATIESPTAEFSAAEAPTVETPTIESPAARSAATMSAKTVAIPRRNESPTVEQPALSAASSDFTAEIDLDDLGLDVKDIEGLPGDLGDLPMASSAESDTREQPSLRDDDALLSATGVTKVLHSDDDEDATAGNTSVLEDQDATLLATGFHDATSTLTGTEVLEGRHEDDESGNTSLVKALRGGGRKDDGVDLDLADLTAALHGADTVEQPRSSSFSRDVFGGGDTPLDLDIGKDMGPGDDDPTGTEEAALDPQTMTEVGTKLDLARAYIDMGDPEGARSILEEVLDEGDATQRREAQGLIDVLSA
jgi:pilus assembly protein FimV